MQLKNMASFLLGGAVLFLVAVAAEGGVQRSQALQRRQRFTCEDYTCSATKTVRTTIGANCVQTCQINCNVMIGLGARDPGITGCSLDNKPFVSSLGSTVLWQSIDARCSCKYCTCNCQYDVDNISRIGGAGCEPATLCGKVLSYSPGYVYSSFTVARRYPCRFPPAQNPNSPKQPTSPKSPNAIDASLQD
ncbi:hypothetical protein C8034_v004880 [Colletotrichum sidae]|uniref:Uncharacterized protein n=1 Tax=Colletotrichum sidae TaxID=1347389 RepID=A0A4R8TUB8_9PEZI|nr:hypothetical protein C8034_v004880 [Colletotrichum sidae]